MNGVALLAGEASGDALGANLMAAMRLRRPGIRFSGVGGPEMQAQGLEVLAAAERLSVMGLVEVLPHLADLWQLRRSLLNVWRKNPPDVFVGIDAPAFNLPLEKALRAQGVKTAHYVSPSLWAWRSGRIHKMKAACDTVLCLFPFEIELYAQHQLRAVCVGHPARDLLKPQPKSAAEAALSWEARPRIGIFPGSRRSEIARLLPIFAQAAQKLQERYPALEIAVSLKTPAPCALPETWRQSAAPAQTLMSACDALLCASGTATLEAALLHRPMVVGYRVHGLTAALARPLLHLPYFSLPNILTQSAAVPELIQERCTAENLTGALEGVWRYPEAQNETFARIEQLLPKDAAGRAAAEVLRLC